MLELGADAAGLGAGAGFGGACFGAAVMFAGDLLRSLCCGTFGQGGAVLALHGVGTDSIPSSPSHFLFCLARAKVSLWPC